MKGYRSMLPGLVLGLIATAALADPVGGEVTAINTLTPGDFKTDLDIDAGLTDAVIVTGTIDNNSEFGWDLEVKSDNLGKLVKGSGGAGREVAYNNIELVRTSGASTLGAGLTDPTGTERDLSSNATNAVGGVAGTTHFFSHTAFAGTGAATSATAGYTFELRITATANAALLSGVYTDNITLTLRNDF